MCVGWWGWGSEFFFLFISLHPSILWVSVKQSESSLVSLRPKFDSRAVLKLRSQSCGPAGTILCRKHSPGVCDSVTRLSERMQDGTKFYQLWQKKFRPNRAAVLDRLVTPSEMDRVPFSHPKNPKESWAVWMLERVKLGFTSVSQMLHRITTVTTTGEAETTI